LKKISEYYEAKYETGAELIRERASESLRDGDMDDEILDRIADGDFNDTIEQMIEDGSFDEVVIKRAKKLEVKKK